MGPLITIAAEPSPIPDWVPKPVADIWRFQLLQVQDSPITVGHLVTFVLVLVLGLIAARILSRLTIGLLVRRVKVHPGAASAVRSLIFYGLAAIVALLALKAINVPLSVFAVAGGALAIGVGFGSQNILNNFISGLILLLERPVRVGDIIQLEGPQPATGVIRRIGARSTRIVSSDNIEIVVPNSTLLQQNVTNWTLSDDEIRASISVGVAYGSPLDKASQALLQAAADHTLVLKEPAPVVLLDDFGDNALVLRLYFWMEVRKTFERRLLESDLRFKVEQLLRDSGIVIAFPQRDVHLDAAHPVSVRVVPAEPSRHAKAAP